MANKTVTLVLVAKSDKGWVRLPTVWGRNGKLRAQYGLIEGEPFHLPEAYYALRTYEGKKTVYRTVGSDATVAAAALAKTNRQITATLAAADADLRLVEESRIFDLRRSRAKWLDKLAAEGKEASVESMTTAIDDFLEATRHTRSDQITDESMTALYAHLRRRGNKDRTIFNKAVALGSWFKFMKLDAKQIIPRRPKYTEKEVEIYDPEQIAALLGSIRSEAFKVAVHLLHKTGMRNEEAIHLKWVNVDFRRDEIRVREDVAAKATIKDRAERTIPLHPDLKAILLPWRAARPEALLVIGTENDTPNRKLLQTLKRAARNAGLNCGNCEGCKGPKECSRWYLHKFRATFTTTLLRSMDARSVMEITGHEDVETVLRYWKPLGRKESAAKVANISWS